MGIDGTKTGMNLDQCRLDGEAAQVDSHYEFEVCEQESSQESDAASQASYENASNPFSKYIQSGRMGSGSAIGSALESFGIDSSAEVGEPDAQDIFHPLGAADLAEDLMSHGLDMITSAREAATAAVSNISEISLEDMKAALTPDLLLGAAMDAGEVLFPQVGVDPSDLLGLLGDEGAPGADQFLNLMTLLQNVGKHTETDS